MTAADVDILLARIIGYWPTPEMTNEEALAWADEMTNPALSITPAETRQWLNRRMTDGWRPRVGDLVAWVRAQRRQASSEYRALTPGTAGVRPAWFADWVDFCAEQIKSALAMGSRIPTRLHLEGLFRGWREGWKEP